LAKILMVIAFGAVGLAAAVTSSMGVCSLCALCAVAGASHSLLSLARRLFFLRAAHVLPSGLFWAAIASENPSKLLKRVATPAGFEPATLSLEG
jgi:Mn2+/Fe2+ NRAMP family transporter